jgi:hypothetical protein
MVSLSTYLTRRMVPVNMERVMWMDFEIQSHNNFKFCILNFGSHRLSVQSLELNNGRDDQLEWNEESFFMVFRFRHIQRSHPTYMKKAIFALTKYIY